VKLQKTVYPLLTILAVEESGEKDSDDAFDFRPADRAPREGRRALFAGHRVAAGRQRGADFAGGADSAVEHVLQAIHLRAGRRQTSAKINQVLPLVVLSSSQNRTLLFFLLSFFVRLLKLT